MGKRLMIDGGQKEKTLAYNYCFIASNYLPRVKTNMFVPFH